MASRTAYSTWTPQKPTLFDGHYLRNRSTLDIGVLGYIGMVQHKEHSPEVFSIPPRTPCILFHSVSFFVLHCACAGQNSTMNVQEWKRNTFKCIRVKSIFLRLQWIQGPILSGFFFQGQSRLYGFWKGSVPVSSKILFFCDAKYLGHFRVMKNKTSFHVAWESLDFLTVGKTVIGGDQASTGYWQGGAGE